MSQQSQQVFTVAAGPKVAAFRAEVLLPLYVYPNPGAWDPLYDCIIAHPQVRFTVIVNPASGPGADPLPDENYITGITRLHDLGRAAGNVRVIGYVATTWGNKPFTVARDEILQYRDWGRLNSDVRIEGIFFDETPLKYHPDGTGLLFKQLYDLVKSIPEFGDGIVVHNPGVVPDSRFGLCADVLIVFEQTYESYRSRRRDDRQVKYANGLFGHLFDGHDENYYAAASTAGHFDPLLSTSTPSLSPPPLSSTKRKTKTKAREYNRGWASLATLPETDPYNLSRANVPFTRSVMGAIIHSCPPDLSAQEIDLLVNDAQEVFGWLFFTDLKVDYYSNFSSRFREFVAALDTTLAARMVSSTTLGSTSSAGWHSRSGRGGGHSINISKSSGYDDSGSSSSVSNINLPPPLTPHPSIPLPPFSLFPEDPGNTSPNASSRIPLGVSPIPSTLPAHQYYHHPGPLSPKHEKFSSSMSVNSNANATADAAPPQLTRRRSRFKTFRDHFRRSFFPSASAPASPAPRSRGSGFKGGVGADGGFASGGQEKKGQGHGQFQPQPVDDEDDTNVNSSGADSGTRIAAVPEHVPGVSFGSGPAAPSPGPAPGARSGGVRRVPIPITQRPQSAPGVPFGHPAYPSDCAASWAVHCAGLGRDGCAAVGRERERGRSMVAAGAAGSAPIATPMAGSADLDLDAKLRRYRDQSTAGAGLADEQVEQMGLEAEQGREG